MQFTEAATLDRKSGEAEGSVVSLNPKPTLGAKKSLNEGHGSSRANQLAQKRALAPEVRLSVHAEPHRMIIDKGKFAIRAGAPGPVNPRKQVSISSPPRCNPPEPSLPDQASREESACRSA
jgi:hypothetical protein